MYKGQPDLRARHRQRQDPPGHLHRVPPRAPGIAGAFLQPGGLGQRPGTGEFGRAWRQADRQPVAL